MRIVPHVNSTANIVDKRTRSREEWYADLLTVAIVILSISIIILLIVAVILVVEWANERALARAIKPLIIIIN